MGAGLLRRLLRRRGRADERVRRLLELWSALLGERGEASGTALARESLAALAALDGAGRVQLLDALAERFGPEPEAVRRTARAYDADPSPANLLRLQAAVEPARQELFRRLNIAPGGTAALVALRRDLLAGLAGHPHWSAVDADLLHLFRSWFNRGFLELRRIDWRTSALILEKLIAYEAVHEIRGWRDLRRRLEADRRCFAFFHPALPDEPLIFLEVALTTEMSGQVGPLLDPEASVGRAEDARCAMFYSITHCQEGLRGVSFGNFLIKQVAEELRQELPRLRTFATLSPVPGFRGWLEEMRSELERSGEGRRHLKRLAALDGGTPAGDADSELKQFLLAACAHYLIAVRRGAEPRDPVARFHLGNGARLERVLWGADLSPTGRARSLGIMVNYDYRLAEVERNHERYARRHEVVAARAVERLARSFPLARPAPQNGDAAAA